MSSKPSNPHQWVLWLFDNLLDVRSVGEGTFKGRLPQPIDFGEVLEGPERQASRVLGLANERMREIEFSPLPAHVYANVDEMIGVASNQIRVPEQFTLRDTGYSGPSDQGPPVVKCYIEAVVLWGALEDIADHVVQIPPSMHFLENAARKIEIKPGFTSEQLKSILPVAEFNRDFVRDEHHREQKRDIVRAVLLDMFGPRGRICLGELIERFEEFTNECAASYAAFSADFSYKNIRDEIDRQNLDDALRLNKTLSDIQNQLLALPAALILAAAGLEPGRGLKNISIVLGVSIFAAIMFMLVRNQRNSVDSIRTEVAARVELVNAQTKGLSARLKGAFVAIEGRVSEQQRTLSAVGWLVFLVWLCVAVLALYQW